MKKANLLIVVALLFLYASSSSAQTFMICEGEKSEAGPAHCLPYDTFVSCYASNERATALCSELGATGTPKLVVMNSVGGNRCGYTNIRVLCQPAPRKPPAPTRRKQTEPSSEK